MSACALVTANVSAFYHALFFAVNIYFLLLAFFRSAALAFTIARSTPHAPHSSVMYFSVLRYLSQPSQL